MKHFVEIQAYFINVKTLNDDDSIHRKFYTPLTKLENIKESEALDIAKLLYTPEFIKEYEFTLLDI